MTHSPSANYHPRWLERLVALLALANFILVIFDWSYVRLRGFYWRTIPSLTQLYDPVKGIQPHPETQNYLNQLDRLSQNLAQTDIKSSEAQKLLAELRQSSQQLIQDNPFEDGNQSHLLAKINQELRTRTRQLNARDGFATFWSSPYLAQAGWQSELEFFNTRLRPLIASNYYREIDSYGQMVNYFWMIDLPFVLVFAIDFLVRTYRISRRRPDLNWLEAILRRWFDLFLLLPFWRWLRVIPVTIRLYQAELLNLEPIRAQLNHDFAISFAQELTEMIGVQVIDQLQETIQRGDFTRWLLHPEGRRPYVQLNNRNEALAIAQRLIHVSVHDVLPQVQPDVNDLIHHTITKTLNRVPLYPQIQSLPGLDGLPSQVIENLANTLSQTLYSNLTGTIDDPKGAEISARLTKNFRDALERELQKSHNLQEIESLLVDMLEEFKINYVERIAEGGLEKAVEETEKLSRQYTRSV